MRTQGLRRQGAIFLVFVGVLSSDNFISFSAVARGESATGAAVLGSMPSSNVIGAFEDGEAKESSRVGADGLVGGEALAGSESVLDIPRRVAEPSSAWAAMPRNGATLPPILRGPETDPSDVYWDDQFGPLGNVKAMFLEEGGHLYVAAEYYVAGAAAGYRLLKWDGTSWSAVGSGYNGVVYAIAQDISGNLYLGGSFTKAGGISASNIVRWDGRHWSALGTGVNGTVYAIAVDPKGNLYVGGDFTSAGG